MRSATAASRSPRDGTRAPAATASSRPAGSSTSRSSSRAASRAGRSARAPRCAGARGRPGAPAALREASLAASPQLRNVGTIGGNLLQSTRCWYWRLDFLLPARRRPLLAREWPAPRARLHREQPCASAHPSDPAAALLALGARIRTDRRGSTWPSSTGYRPRTIGRRRRSRRRADPRARATRVRGSVYLKAMDRKRWASPSSASPPRGSAARRGSRSRAPRRCRSCSSRRKRSSRRPRCPAPRTRSTSPARSLPGRWRASDAATAAAPAARPPGGGVRR